LIAVVMTATPASAQTCLQDEYNKVQKQKLNCTANDVRIAKVTNVRDPITGAAITSCVNGSTFSFLADFEIVTTSSQARENIGLYIATTNQSQALKGDCVDNIIAPGHHADGTTCTVTPNGVGCFGSDNYHTKDPAPDNCGDTSSNDSSPTFGAGAELVTLRIDNFLCEAPAGSNQVQLPNCTSWQIPGGTIQCVAQPPSYAYPFNGPGGTPTAIPGSPAKCNCAVIPLGVTVQTPGINVGKACTTGGTSPSSPNPPTFTLAADGTLTSAPTSCDIKPEGGTVTYTVDIENDKSNFGSVVVDQVCDSAYGQIFPASGTCDPGTQCAAPNNVTGTGCATSTTCTGATVALNGNYQCKFTAEQAEDKVITNIASVLVHGSSSGTQAGGSSNSVTVTSHEAPTTAEVDKGVNATTAACATIRYSVDVKNTSAAGTDETLTLTGLNDNGFGDITTCQTGTGCTATGNPKILGTTCGVDAGIGTLTGTNGAGSFGATGKIIAVGGDYSCLFDAQICSGLTNGCFTHSNRVTASLSGDEGGELVTVSTVPDPLNVKVCVATTTF
jgi:hypothetical protein